MPALPNYPVVPDNYSSHSWIRAWPGLKSQLQGFFHEEIVVNIHCFLSLHLSSSNYWAWSDIICPIFERLVERYFLLCTFGFVLDGTLSVILMPHALSSSILPGLLVMSLTLFGPRLSIILAA